jgi:hypothetical protein
MLESISDEAPSVLYFGISCEDSNCLLTAVLRSQALLYGIIYIPNATSFGALIHAVSLR